MVKKRIKRFQDDQKGSTLIIVVIIIMVLTSIGLYGLTATGVEIASSTSEKRDKIEFANAEAGLRFAINYFEPIYENSNKKAVLGLLYPSIENEFDVNGRPTTLSQAIDGTIDVLYSPNAAGTALRDYLPAQLSSAFVVFDYSVGGARVARVEIKAIQLNPIIIAGLSNKANDVPLQRHMTAAPPNYDRDRYKSRNFQITSTALASDGTISNTTVASGVVVAAEIAKFNQYNNL
jgi:Tfp pilus assembly protein PilX